MNILFIGDVVGNPGRKVVKHFLNKYGDEYDFVIANLENASHGKGLTRNHFLQMLEAGIDVVTLGNHYYAKKEIETFIKNYNLEKIEIDSMYTITDEDKNNGNDYLSIMTENINKFKTELFR